MNIFDEVKNISDDKFQDLFLSIIDELNFRQENFEKQKEKIHFINSEIKRIKYILKTNYYNACCDDFYHTKLEHLRHQRKQILKEFEK